jgi:hypothetical protein
MATEEGIHHFVRELNLPKHAPFITHMGAAEKKWNNDRFPTSLMARTQQTASAHNAPFYLGRVLSEGENEILFERVFDLERDSYLGHHLVNGYATLPGTFVPEIAAEAASKLVPGLNVIALEDAVFHHFLRVYDKRKPSVKKIHARIVERTAEQTVVQVRILTDVVAPTGSVLTRDKPHFEIKVVLSTQVPPAPQWEAWDSAREIAVPDPYHFPLAPVLLTDMFVSTAHTRLHPRGKRATYHPRLKPDDPIFSSFILPSILLDGLARVAVLNFVEDAYIPVVAPATVRRIDVYEAANDCLLAQKYKPIELYVTPRDVALEQADTQNRCVAVRPDGKVILQINDMKGIIMGYVHRTTGEFLARSQMEDLRQQQIAFVVTEGV